MNKRLVKKIFRKVRDANLKYHMIENGDTVAVGIAGGKDSLTTLHFLYLLKKYTPLEFTLVPILLDLGFNNDNKPAIAYCEDHGLNLTIIPTNIGKIVFDIRQEKSPCSLCANLRRGALNRTAKELGCNKVALGHHFDDAIETFALSLLYEGRLSCFCPVTQLAETGLTVIRPMLYLHEKTLRNFCAREELPVLHNPCPADHKTQREDAKALLYEMEGRYPGLKAHIFGALQRSDLEGWRIYGTET